MVNRYQELHDLTDEIVKLISEGDISSPEFKEVYHKWEWEIARLKRKSIWPPRS